VIGRNGVRHTILNFHSEADAKAWIVQDKKLDRYNGLAAE
jgi:hypothetical protein